MHRKGWSTGTCFYQHCWGGGNLWQSKQPVTSHTPSPCLIHSSLSANTPNYASALPLKLICWAVPEATIRLTMWNLSHIFHLLMKSPWVTTETDQGCCPTGQWVFLQVFSSGKDPNERGWTYSFVAEISTAQYFSVSFLNILHEILPVCWALWSCRVESCSAGTIDTVGHRDFFGGLFYAHTLNHCSLCGADLTVLRHPALQVWTTHCW